MQESSRRVRLALFAFLVFLVPMAAWVRFRAPVEAQWRDWSGGAAYVLFWSASVQLLRPGISSRRSTGGVFLVTCGLEFLQLWHPAPLEALFGPGANPNGHGHNYIVEVTVEGEPDPTTGMVMDLKDLKQILESEVVEPMDHRFLNHEVAPFNRVVPTTENVAAEIWRRVEPRINSASAKLARVRLFETADLYVDVTRDPVIR